MNKTSPPPLYSTTYDSSSCETGVVHIGFGAFHRAHQAVYLDDYMESTGDLRWGIAAVNLRPSESDILRRCASCPDGYILKSMSPSGSVSYRRVRSHINFLDWSLSPEASENLLVRPTVHLVTITVTESGYYLDKDGNLDSSHPVIASELSGGTRESVYAYMAGALDRRVSSGGGPLTFLCCDNLRSNGSTLRRNFLAYLELLGESSLYDWTCEHATFPDSMVDRITPRSTPDLSIYCSSFFGCPEAIHCEEFSQWVIEDKFGGPFPSLNGSEVSIVSNVEPYEEAKIRILNGGHTSLAYLAALSDIPTFDAAMNNADLRRHFDGYEREEVLPGFPSDFPLDKDAYLTTVCSRFCNELISDSTERICADGWSKFQIFVRPTLEATLESGRLPKYGIDSIASWYCFGRRVLSGSTQLNYMEPNWSFLEPLLSPDSMEDFCHSSILWSDLPVRFPEFSESLFERTKEVCVSWRV